MKNHTCRGCSTVLCVIKDKDNCPCKVCLVKPICTTTCKKRAIFRFNEFLFREGIDI